MTDRLHAFDQGLAPTVGGFSLTHGKLIESVRITQLYQQLYTDYFSRGVIQELDSNDKEFDSNSGHTISRYFDVGEDGLRVIVQALIGNCLPPPKSILDLPSGSGRVTRHLRSFFPTSRIVACDLYDYHVDFCQRILKVEGVLSKENIADVDFGETFDLIFCGSLLTHLPEVLFRKTIDFLCRCLSENGIAVVTLHGRYSEYLQKHRMKYLDDQLFDVALEGLNQTGFGYVDYGHDFKQKFDQQASYGIALVRADWLMKCLQTTTDMRILGYIERGWDEHQDVVIFGKPSINV